MDGLRRIIDHLQLRLAGGARHDMETLDDGSCIGCGLVITVAGRSQLLSEALHAISNELLWRGRASNRWGSTCIPLSRSSGIRLPGVRFPASFWRRSIEYSNPNVYPTGSRAWWAVMNRQGRGGRSD